MVLLSSKNIQTNKALSPKIKQTNKFEEGKKKGRSEKIKMGPPPSFALYSNDVFFL